VLVIERGYFDDKPEAIVPWYANGLDTSVMIRPQSAPIPGLRNATYSVAVAAVVGGGSVVNGMGFARGSKTDYDAWEELGNPGWGWEGLLPYFRKSSTFHPPSPRAAARWNMTWDLSVYGNGPVPAHISDFQYPDNAVVWDAMRNQPGLPVPQSPDAGYGSGAFWAPSSIDSRTQTRATARSAYYDPVNATRPNLRLVTGQTATEILFSPGRPLRAKGVRMVSRLDNTRRDVYARKEVILAAGAIQTPQLLQYSGIGPASVLQAAGVEVKKDMPCVGANLQDHPSMVLQFNLSNQSFPNPDTITTNATFNATAWDEYLTNRTGPLTTAGGNTIIWYSLSHLNSSAAAFSLASRLLDQDARLYLPEVYQTSPALLRGFLAQRALLSNQFNTTTSRIAVQPLRPTGISPASLLKPLSRGTVTLNASNPLHGGGLPVVQYNTFQNPLDAETVASIVRRARKFWSSPELSPLHPVEVAPGPQYQTDEEILNALLSTVNTPVPLLRPSLAHPSGTCAMMPERLGGCVGPDLRVYGVKGLRVVDASVQPLIIGTALQSTVYAVAEKAADLIRFEAGG
jgi:choline dehydrogenase-like flavoprotein